MNRPAAGGNVQVDASTQGFQNEVEGTIWEFKIIPRTSESSPTDKQEEAEVQEEATVDNDKPAGPKGRARGGDAKSQQEASKGTVTVDDDGTMRGKLRIKGNAVYDGSFRRQSAEDEHRIGDCYMESKNGYTECTLRFDDYKLKGGRAVFNSNNRGDGGVYTGYYVDEHKKRWRLELRRGES